jgi:hypothetical protein
MATPQITIHNVATGEIITRDLNADELAQQELDKAQAEAQAAAQTEAQAAKLAARQAVLDKLGLTADEVAALFG